MSYNTCSHLKNLSFSDLIIGDHNVYIKGVPGCPEIVEIDEFYKDEAFDILKELKKQNENEFLYMRDGVHYRTAKMETINGTWFTLRKGMQNLPTLSQLGVSKTIIEACLDESYTHGLLVFSGEMGSGKTTSASAYVKERLNLIGGHAVALEDPPELPLQGVHGDGVCFQQEVKNRDFASAIISALRWASPRIIFLGELRDEASVSEALRAAINGHVIVATIHAAGIVETIDRIDALAKIKDGSSASGLLATGLFGIIHQRLATGRDKGKKLKTKVLFAKHSASSVRAKIRDGKTHQLNTEIQAQQNEMFLKKDR